MPCYLLHFDRPFKHAKHYLGYASTTRLRRRLREHERAAPGDGRNHVLLTHVRAAGIGWTVARIWPDGTRDDERRMKQNTGKKFCPICKGNAKGAADV